MVIAVCLCLGGYYYYQIFLPNQKGNFSLEQPLEQPIIQSPDFLHHGKETNKEQMNPEDSPKTESCEKMKRQISYLKEELSTINKWKSSMNAHLTRMQWEQDIKINNAIEENLEIFEADSIGLMDYAATYAGGMIVEVSKETRPHPTHRPLSFFKIVNVDVLSSPEEIIRPCVLPGSCFAFRGSYGSVRIKLGKPINIGGVTLSHASRYLLGSEGMNSAPKDFEVYGYTETEDKIGAFLGKFTYNWNGRQHQTFEVKKNLSKNRIFEEIQLTVLSNYGKDEFTCVYRIRVHKSDAEGSSGRSREKSKNKSHL